MSKENKEKAIVLISGGMDSLSITQIASENYELAALHLNYGQNTQDKELQCFHEICDHYQIKERKVVDMSFLSQIGGSSLTDKKIEVAEFDETNTEVPTSYVPFRNTHILSLAVSWAEILGASKIFIGAVFEDHQGYPDCRPSYYQAFNELIKQGTKEANIEVITPIIHKKKDEILKIIIDAKAPIEKTWSCYKESDIACGECDSCGLRLKAFKSMGLSDPLQYR